MGGRDGSVAGCSPRFCVAQLRSQISRLVQSFAITPDTVRASTTSRTSNFGVVAKVFPILCNLVHKY